MEGARMARRMFAVVDVELLNPAAVRGNTPRLLTSGAPPFPARPLTFAVAQIHGRRCLRP
jgi:hypothetical protein